MKFAYTQELRLNAANRSQLSTINGIIEEYRKQGYRLSLRQLYYQLVSRGVVSNNVKEYAKLSTLLTKGRMAGVVDWDAIEDRIRKPYIPASWKSPKEILDACAKQYRRDRMSGQENYIEVWVEKDALSEVLKRSTDPYHVRVMVNRGYSSTSAMHDAYLRFQEALDEDDTDSRKVVILYLGDHDPSGMDMVRDIRDRIKEFFWGAKREDYNDDEDEFTTWYDLHFEVVRIALNMDQIRQYNPPPNPAKFSDPRANGYVAKYGRQSWEVDALEPRVLHKLVQDNIIKRIDDEQYEQQLSKEKKERDLLKEFAKSTKHEGDDE